MAYTVLARRYRSTSFDSVIGQEPIARTLQNAIEHDRVAHAYLFCGTRGVGKTSMARIFAKALNAPGDEPADVAAAIMQGRDTDVIEIDGASNNKVEEARELIANCVYRPMRGRYKIYIIDEVHMLTTAAFNALLKTMEEPPEHVVFILCTTEPHKVPPTIQSRCQRFDFRNIASGKIAGHLRAVIEKEGLEADDELVHTVARLGAGSMRDALSLLDRLMAFGEGRLTTELLERLLGLPDRTLILQLISAMADGDPGAALATTDQLLQRGAAAEQLLDTLAESLRELMLLSACGPETDLVDLSGEGREQAAAVASRFDAAGLCHMIALCDSVSRSCRSSAAPRALLDAAIVRMAMSEKIADVTALALGNGQASGGAPGPKKAAAPAQHAPAPAEMRSIFTPGASAPSAGQAAPAGGAPKPRIVLPKPATPNASAQQTPRPTIGLRPTAPAPEPKPEPRQAPPPAREPREQRERPQQQQQQPAPDPDQPPPASPADIAAHPLVRKSMEIFGRPVLNTNQNENDRPSEG